MTPAAESLFRVLTQPYATEVALLSIQSFEHIIALIEQQNFVFKNMFEYLKSNNTSLASIKNLTLAHSLSLMPTNEVKQIELHAVQLLLGRM